MATSPLGDYGALPPASRTSCYLRRERKDVHTKRTLESVPPPPGTRVSSRVESRWAGAGKGPTHPYYPDSPAPTCCSSLSPMLSPCCPHVSPTTAHLPQPAMVFPAGSLRRDPELGGPLRDSCCVTVTLLPFLALAAAAVQSSCNPRSLIHNSGCGAHWRRGGGGGEGGGLRVSLPQVGLEGALRPELGLPPTPHAALFFPSRLPACHTSSHQPSLRPCLLTAASSLRTTAPLPAPILWIPGRDWAKMCQAGRGGRTPGGPPEQTPPFHRQHS